MLNKTWSRNHFHNNNIDCIWLEQPAVCDIWCTTHLWNIVSFFKQSLGVFYMPICLLF